MGGSEKLRRDPGQRGPGHRRVRGCAGKYFAAEVNDGGNRSDRSVRSLHRLYENVTHPGIRASDPSRSDFQWPDAVTIPVAE